VSDVVFRPLAAGELDLFHAYPAEPGAEVGERSRSYDEEVAGGEYRPGWVWVALRGGEVVARAAFWAPAGFPHPFSLDRFDPGVGPDRVDLGAGLLRAAYAALVPPDYTAPPHPAGGRPDYHLFLPADWRDQPVARAAATTRIAAAERAGLRLFVQRLNLRWTSADGLPPRSTRLVFTEATDDRVVTDVLARVCTATLDAYAQRDIAEVGRRRAAEQTIEEVAAMPGGRAWWRLAHDQAGALVGIVMPTRNSSTATIGYLGVVPEHRGRHYSDDLVTEALHLFAAAGCTEANDNTDIGNTPMAATFARVGYHVTGHRMILT
jgi:GNAT superfamily N-acetyltransferase